jgi:RNA-directed DNA polymerase
MSGKVQPTMEQFRQCWNPAKQGTEIQRDWDWVEASVWTQRMLAALVNGVKGGKWYSLFDKLCARSTLERAWLKVESNRGAAGVDRISIERFRANAVGYLDELGRSLKEGTYQPLPVKRVYIPKGKNQLRPLGIPAVKDRIVQTALKMVLEPIFENEFLDMSYGFRPGKGCKDALREVDTLVKAGYVFVVDADLKSYFDSIPHTQLLGRIAEKVSDGRIISLLEQFLNQDIMDGLNRWTPTSGSPQGAVASPLLANLYLHPLDVIIMRSGFKMVRYADDLVILCKTANEALAALTLLQDWTRANGLTLHPDKTHVGNCLELGHGFQFLGYHFESGRRTVRAKSLKALKEKLRQRTRRTRGDSLDRIIEDINPTLRGWFAYFKHAHKFVFSSLDGFVRRRLRAILRRREKRPGQGKCYADHRRWPNAFFATHGLFTMTVAHAQASRPR